MTLFTTMKKIFNILIGVLLIGLTTACGKSDNAMRPQTGYLLVFGDDSCRCITYEDAPLFTLPYKNTSLFYNDIATVQDANNKWHYIDREGEYKITGIYDKTTVFSEGMAWVIKEGDMPGAINERGDIKISLRDTQSVRVFIEGLAAIAIVKKGKLLWGFIDKDGNEVVKPQYQAVSDFRLGLAAVQDSEGKWGYINLRGESMIACQYEKALTFNDKGHAIVKTPNGYYIIDRKGTIIQSHAYDEMLPDKLWYMVRSGDKWGWCDETGKCVIQPAFQDIRPFGDGNLAPVKIRGKWGYIDHSGSIAIKRQFFEAYPFVDGCAAVQTGTVWGFINEKGFFIVNPQYDNVPKDYLMQSLGLGSAMNTLRIK